MCGSDIQCPAALDLSCWQQIPSSKSANHHVLPCLPVGDHRQSLGRPRHGLPCWSWTGPTALVPNPGAAMAEEVEGGGLLRRRLFMEQQIDTALHFLWPPPPSCPPFTLHLACPACMPGIGGGDAGHLMRIRMTSLSLQPNDASTLQPSLINAVQWCGVDCPLHLLVFTHSFSLSSSSHLHAEQKSRTCMVYVQYRCHSWPVHQLCKSAWSRLKAKGHRRFEAHVLLFVRLLRVVLMGNKIKKLARVNMLGWIYCCCWWWRISTNDYFYYTHKVFPANQPDKLFALL